MTVMKMLAEGYSYSLISTLAGINKKTVVDIAKREGVRKKYRKAAKTKKVNNDLVCFAEDTKLPSRKYPDFILLVQENNRVRLPHPDQCKHILSLKGHGEDQDHYCQNKRTGHKPYCTACQKKLFIKNYQGAL